MPAARQTPRIISREKDDKASRLNDRLAEGKDQAWIKPGAEACSSPPAMMAAKPARQPRTSEILKIAEESPGFLAVKADAAAPARRIEIDKIRNI